MEDDLIFFIEKLEWQPQKKGRWPKKKWKKKWKTTKKRKKKKENNKKKNKKRQPKKNGRDFFYQISKNAILPHDLIIL